MRVVLGTAAVLAVASCGGAGGGQGPAGAGQGLALESFLQDGVDNLSLNAVLQLTFSEPVDPATVTAASVQLREGGDFGLTVQGEFFVNGAVLEFRPRLPGLCDHSDSGLKPNTTYRLILVGHPEEFCVRNTRGQSLDHTQTHEFSTRLDTDPRLLDDQLPGSPPHVLSCTPADGTAAVTVEKGNQVVLDFDQNLDPCSVDDTTILLHQYEVGDPNVFLAAPNGNETGFDSVTRVGSDPYSWGASNSTTMTPPRGIPATIVLEQTFTSTRVVITPEFGEFYDNALLVVEVTSGVKDFGGQLAVPFRAGFTTENRPPQEGFFRLHFAGEVDVDDELTTADVNTPRAPSLAQGYLLFSGDGDNGTNPLVPTLPSSSASGCTTPLQVNDGTKDDFDPQTNVILDTGASPNTCTNSTDGSRAVVWEFNSFRIRSGITVRVVGRNPAIILVVGDAIIDSGGTLLVRGDAQSGAPQGYGANGSSTSSASAKPGGTGVAGGGDGGDANTVGSTSAGDWGFSGVGSADYDASMTDGGSGEGGVGAGEGGTPDQNSDTFGSGSSQGGGGGGHATGGVMGTGTAGQNLYGSVHSFIGPLRGAGGGTYPSGSQADKMLTPSAGSGGGGAGDSRGNGGTYDSLGGAGGAGGGFVDLTVSGGVYVYGTIDAAGSRGGNGYYDQAFTATGGGGGGSGGGIRLLTPFDIDVTGGTLSAGGGVGGGASSPTNKPNVGGAGGNGRIVMEDGDSVITGQGAASMTPNEGSPGFYRGVFSAGRFKGGGLEPAVVTQRFYIGPFSATFVDPQQVYGAQADFVAGVPRSGSRGNGSTAILVEMQGYPLLSDGKPNLAAPSGWYTVGHLTDSTVDSQPVWHLASQPADGIAPPGDNVGAGIANLDGSGMVEVRMTFYLPTGIGPFEPGPYVDRWDIRFNYDQ